ncbi:ABC transporter substrate-binding protein [Rhodococcus koreensis]
MPNRISLAAAAALVALAASSCTQQTDALSQSGGNISTIQSGSLTACSDVPAPPFEDFDSSSPTGFKGFDIDIASAVADGMGLNLVVKDSSFDAIQSGQVLYARQCDLAISSMNITEERKASLDFSGGYYDVVQSILIPVDSTISNSEDLNGRKVGVQQGSTGQEYANKSLPDSQVFAFPSDAEMLAALNAGQVEALINDLPVNLIHTSSGSFEIVSEIPTGQQYGMAVRKGNTALLEAINTQITNLHNSGKYDEIYDRYFSTK